MMARAAGIITITVVLLPAAGMHALMSFTIAQRTREIGIRSALGAQPRQLLPGVFGRSMRQLSIGVGVGSVISMATVSAAGIGLGRGAALLATVSVLMTIVASGCRPSTRCASMAGCFAARVARECVAWRVGHRHVR
jgi:ABC-type antimicrobial peptide transport system permease subunit